MSLGPFDDLADAMAQGVRRATASRPPPKPTERSVRTHALSRADKLALWQAKHPTPSTPKAFSAKKQCCRCHAWKPRNARMFARKSDAPDGLQALCKACDAARSAVQVKEHHETVKRGREAARVARQEDYTRGTQSRVVSPDVAPAPGSPRSATTTPVVVVDLFGAPPEGEPVELGSMADACDRTSRAYEREGRERLAYVGPGPSLAAPWVRRTEGADRAPNRAPPDRPQDLWTADDQRATDAWVDDYAARWARGVMAERERLVALGWNEKAGIDG